jgi:hypothetical protein
LQEVFPFPHTPILFQERLKEKTKRTSILRASERVAQREKSNVKKSRSREVFSSWLRDFLFWD